MNSTITFGQHHPGWTRTGWVDELRRKAARCDKQERADYFNAWADDLEPFAVGVCPDWIGIALAFEAQYGSRKRVGVNCGDSPCGE